MTETTTSPHCDVTYSRSHIQTVALQGRTLSSTDSCRRQPLDSMAPIIDVGDAPGAQTARCQQDAIHLPRDTMRVQTPKCLPSHLRIPAALKRRHARMRRRDEGEVFFFCCEETCGSGITMSKDLTSPRLASISNPQTPRRAFIVKPRLFAGVTFATSCYHIPSNAWMPSSLSLGRVLFPP
ncbi:hypothetical protein ARMGADRAFT_575780 [Armillaria gallica]|uniref:Uncharacterized protein n=1 Tax=Armillaria gallica TaxID=47427 RepID=A0A2H3E3Y2_ARMGA|nr:hypothetical protein ARMGADRAFT_575780 [Armillaria gallica]